jgi:hypothetical protein
MVLKGRITAITADIRTTETFQRITKLLRDNGIVTDSIYISNICCYMYGIKNKQSFTESIKSIVNPETIVVNCPITPDTSEEQLPQYTCRALDLQKDWSHLFSLETDSIE